MPKPRTGSPRIALLIDTSVTFSSLVIRGVARFAREHSNWQLLLQPRGVHQHGAVPKHWEVDGVITRVTHRTQAAALGKLGLPVVNVSRSRVPGYPFPQVVSDERESARLAAEHLLERGFRRLAYCRIANQPNYQDHMGPTFAAELRRLRVAKAQELLAGTNWSMPRIAAAAGFSRAEIMNRVFRRELDQTPTEYRRTLSEARGQR